MKHYLVGNYYEYKNDLKTKFNAKFDNDCACWYFSSQEILNNVRNFIKKMEEEKIKNRREEEKSIITNHFLSLHFREIDKIPIKEDALRIWDIIKNNKNNSEIDTKNFQLAWKHYPDFMKFLNISTNLFLISDHEKDCVKLRLNYVARQMNW